MMKKIRLTLMFAMAFFVVSSTQQCKPVHLTGWAISDIVMFSVAGVGGVAMYATKKANPPTILSEYYQTDGDERPRVKGEALKTLIADVRQGPDGVVKRAFGCAASEELYEFVREVSDLMNRMCKAYGNEVAIYVANVLQTPSISGPFGYLFGRTIIKKFGEALGVQEEVQSLAKAQEAAIKSMGTTQVKLLRQLMLG